MVNIRSPGTPGAAFRLVALLVAVGALVGHADTDGAKAPRLIQLNEMVTDTIEEYTDVHNYNLGLPDFLRHDDLYITFEWASGLPWFLLKCDGRPSVAPLDATWLVRPDRGEVSASLELSNHQCYGPGEKLWLKVYAFNPVFDYTIQFKALGTRLTSLAMNFRPPFENGGVTQSLSAEDAFFYKFRAPKSAENAVITSYEFYGFDGNDIEGCYVEIGFFTRQTDRWGDRSLNAIGGTPDRIPCKAFTSGVSRRTLSRQIRVATLSNFEDNLYIGVAHHRSTRRDTGAPRLGSAYGKYNLAQTTYSGRKGYDDRIPRSINLRSLSLVAPENHRPLAVSFDFAMPKTLDLYDPDTPVHSFNSRVGASSWQYYTYRTTGPLVVDFRFEADAEIFEVTAVLSNDIPTLSRYFAKLPNFSETNDTGVEVAPYSRWHNGPTTVHIGVRGPSHASRSQPFTLVIGANYAKLLRPFALTPDVVKSGHWSFFTAPLRRTARVQLPIRVPIEGGVELYVEVDQYPTTASQRAVDVDGTPGVRCVEFPVAGDGTLYIGVHGAAHDSDETGDEQDGTFEFELQLLLNGFDACDFFE